MAQKSSPRAPHSDLQVLLFIVALCFTCALLLAGVAYTLRVPQKLAKEFDQSKQMLIAAKILSPSGYFEILEEDGAMIPAQFEEATKLLVSVDEEDPPLATEDQIQALSDARIRPLLTNKEGNVFTLEEKDLDLTEYLEKNQKTGYANLPLKLFYVMLPNKQEAFTKTAKEAADSLDAIYSVVIPVSGFGLWAPIYGFLAVEPNGDTVIGTTWYEQAETPGLGANISEPNWQKQFYGKLIFQESPGGEVDFQTAEMGIIVVKGKVQDVYGSSPKGRSAVDGMSGATLTGDGVTDAYRNSLTPYREFLIKLEEDKS
ncbi:MAG: Na(+)-translocating NADH-quinone reductase subunit C [Chlamydiae bacterium]|nr:Na(+)-translocating NADH-quinone reductase subunit C [Chlamydiota bacterium]